MNSAIATVMVSDMDRSAKFYRDTLGLTERMRVPGWAEYACDDGFVVALHDARPNTPLPPNGGVSIGFGVEGLDAERARLEAAGVRFFGPTVDNPPVRLAFFADPDGYPLYLSERSGGPG